jgi:hypothetical protein
MRYTKRILTFIFAIVLLMGTAAIAASAQGRGGRRFHRPVRVYYVQRDPFWSWNSWGNPYYYDPYYNERQQRYYMESRLQGNRRELAEHLEKYNADSVLTAKERRELEDDYKDVDRARADLSRYRNY